MLRIIPNGEGKAKLTRNKRGGVRLKIHVDISWSGSYCEECWMNGKNMMCLDMCREFERVTGTRRFWFERGEVENN